jgi:hypothetical protein
MTLPNELEDLLAYIADLTDALADEYLEIAEAFYRPTTNLLDILTCLGLATHEFHVKHDQLMPSTEIKPPQ